MGKNSDISWFFFPLKDTSLVWLNTVWFHCFRNFSYKRTGAFSMSSIKPQTGVGANLVCYNHSCVILRSNQSPEHEIMLLSWGRGPCLGKQSWQTAQTNNKQKNLKGLFQTLVKQFAFALESNRVLHIFFPTRKWMCTSSLSRSIP